MNAMNKIYQILQKFPRQPLEIGDIARLVADLPGRKYSAETIRRDVADMTFQENKTYLAKYPCMIRHGDGIYSYDPRKKGHTLEKFFKKKERE